MKITQFYGILVSQEELGYLKDNLNVKQNEKINLIHKIHELTNGNLSFVTIHKDNNFPKDCHYVAITNSIKSFDTKNSTENTHFKMSDLTEESVDDLMAFIQHFELSNAAIPMIFNV